MPQNNDQINLSELTAASNQAAQFQQLNSALDQLYSKLNRAVDLFGQMRAYTKDELKELTAFRDIVEDVAGGFRKMYGEQVKGMSDFQVAVRAMQDRLARLHEQEQKFVEEERKSREKLQKIDEANGKKNQKEKLSGLKEALGLEKASASEIYKERNKQREALQKELDARAEQRKSNQQLISEEKKKLDLAEKIKKSGKERVLFDEEEKQRRSRGVGLLEMASDMHIPGVSQAATIAKYARRGAESAEEEGGSKGMGLMRGGLLGVGIAGLGYTMLQGYKAYNASHQMAPMARTLQGQMGEGAPGALRSAIGAYGSYGGIENLQTLMALNSQLGGRAGLQNLHPATDVSNAFGIGREEVGAHAGALMRAGGAAPESAVESLKKVMVEGVKGGMDRARITEFTQQIVGLQEGIYQLTGENNAQAISQAIAQLMRASGKGEQFLRGPEMTAVRGMDSAVKNAGRGGSGAGTLFRSFGFGAGADPGMFGKDYYEARKKLEGGIFQGSSKDIVKNIQGIIGQYDKESGGNNQIANLRMSDELGIGINQVEKLRGVSARTKESGKLTKDDENVVQNMKNEGRDPLIRLVEIQSQSNEKLAQLASSAEGIGAVEAIDRNMFEVQKASLEILKNIADSISIFGGTNKYGQGYNMFEKGFAKLMPESLGGMSEVDYLDTYDSKSSSREQIPFDLKRDEARKKAIRARMDVGGAMTDEELQAINKKFSKENWDNKKGELKPQAPAKVDSHVEQQLWGEQNRILREIATNTKKGAHTTTVPRGAVR